jgi:hypothetical protein
VVLADKIFVKAGVFYKKKPLRPAAGAQLGKKLIRPPEKFFVQVLWNAKALFSVASCELSTSRIIKSGQRRQSTWGCN